MPVVNVVNKFTPALVLLLNPIMLSIHTLVDPLKISLSPAQVKKLMKVAANRALLIKAILTSLMEVFPETIPSTTTLADFTAMNQEEIDSQRMGSILLALSSIFFDHAAIIRNNESEIAKQSLDLAKLLSKTEPDIKTATALIITDFFTKAAKKAATAYGIAISGNIVVGGVKTNKYFTNTGTSILKFLKVDGLVIDTITVNPSSSVLIPKGWTNITVTNLSATNTGSFSVFIK